MPQTTSYGFLPALLEQDPLYKSIYSTGQSLLEPFSPEHEAAVKGKAWGDTAQKQAERYSRAGLTGGSEELGDLERAAQNFELAWTEREPARKAAALSAVLPIENFLKSVTMDESEQTGYYGPTGGTATFRREAWDKALQNQQDQQDWQLLGGVLSSLGVPQWLAKELFGVSPVEDTLKKILGLKGDVAGGSSGGLVGQIKDWLGIGGSGAGGAGTAGGVAGGGAAAGGAGALSGLVDASGAGASFAGDLSALGGGLGASSALGSEVASLAASFMAQGIPEALAIPLAQSVAMEGGGALASQAALSAAGGAGALGGGTALATIPGLGLAGTLGVLAAPWMLGAVGMMLSPNTSNEQAANEMWAQMQADPAYLQKAMQFWKDYPYAGNYGVPGAVWEEYLIPRMRESGRYGSVGPGDPFYETYWQWRRGEFPGLYERPNEGYATGFEMGNR